MSRPAAGGKWHRFWQKLPLLVWLVVVWGALWQNFSPGNLLFGLAIAWGVSRALYLPPVELSGRFNLPRALWFALWFLKEIIVASCQVFLWAVAKGPRIRNAVVAVPLRSRSDLVMTAVGHVLSLIPGSLVVEVDRGTSTLYVHAMNAPTPDSVEKVRTGIQDIEVKIIRIMGSRQELAALSEEARTPGRPAQGTPPKEAQ
ncbi:MULTISPECIES: Na+/H+ antiporter subunit E [unclassified Arthrobacter]|uniref:Na+/H+ antiporter subunit E n=1 Tax=unclassified Arthrobacter TaxID=235627 RepID=UPI00159D19F3|nr:MULTISPECIES: Na+/H+ antiporter subunit E [unclassified Arthrobacter]MCQ9164768.1 Na+/H+ antiporter subunit E [Arthrobacter sp. STN4]NVM98784.1 Na+/H+ antiporter subunit E [Arthrobacter sp. SDTb3-6]